MKYLSDGIIHGETFERMCAELPELLTDDDTITSVLGILYRYEVEENFSETYIRFLDENLVDYIKLCVDINDEEHGDRKLTDEEYNAKCRVCGQLYAKLRMKIYAFEHM